MEPTKKKTLAYAPEKQMEPTKKKTLVNAQEKQMEPTKKKTLVNAQDKQVEQTKKTTLAYAPERDSEPKTRFRSDRDFEPKNRIRSSTVRLTSNNASKSVQAKRNGKYSYGTGSQTDSRMKGMKKEDEETQLDKKITPLNEVDPMTDDLSVQARCISIWHSHRVNQEKDPYSLDLVLQDVENNRIQVYIKKELIYKYEPLFVEGQCYQISNFGVAENGGKLPLLPHKFKIAVHRNTTVTRINPIDDNIKGFVFDNISTLWESQNQISELDAVDVIGTVVAIGDIVPLNWSGAKKLRRTVVLQDSQENEIECTFWDAWAERWNEYSENREKKGHTVCILQLGKVKYWNGKPAVNNALFGSKLYINNDLPEIHAFRQSYEAQESYNQDDYKIALLSPNKPVVTVESFFKETVKTMIDGIRDCEPGSHCVVYATIHRIHSEHGWCYLACKECSRKVDPVMSKGPASSGARNRKQAYTCEKHGSVYQVVKRFKCIIRIIDDSGSAPLVVFDSNVSKLCGKFIWEVLDKHPGEDTNTYYPREDLERMVGKKVLFKLLFSEYNIRRNDYTYRCEAVSSDKTLINYFKKSFFGEPDSDDELKHSQDSDDELKHSQDSDDELTEIPETPYEQPHDDESPVTNGRSNGNGKKRGMIHMEECEDNDDEESTKPKKPFVEGKKDQE